MNTRTEQVTNTYKPMLAVMVYRGHNSFSGSEYYLESHQVDDSGNILEGKPLLQETMQEVVDVFFDERKNAVQVHGIIPDNLLTYDALPGGQMKMIWYRPAEIRVMHFASQLKLKTEKVWVPAMLYAAEKNSLSVWALKSNTRPTMNSKIYYAPYFNVSDNGSVCLGNADVAKPKDKTYSSLMKYWEDLFWLSEFTHLNGSDVKTKSDLQAVWKKLIESRTKLKWSDLNELVQVKKNATLKSIIK